MSIRAKFMVVEKIETTAGYTVKLSAVTSGSPEDAEFFKWTPSGVITLSTITDSTALGFKTGKKYYVDFTEAVE